jgi:hypothetical protein
MFFTGSNGRATFFTGSLSGSTGVAGQAVAGSGHFRYNSDESATNYSTALTSGLYAIYRERPSLTVGINSASMIYGDTLPTGLASVTGALNGDTAAQIFNGQAAVAGTQSSSGNFTAGGHTVSVTSGTADLLGYFISNTASGTLTVNSRPINITADSGKTKIYGDADPTFTSTAQPLGSSLGLIVGDTFTGALARVAGDNVNTYLINSVGNLTNSNYAITVVPANFSITQRPITLTADARSKNYGDSLALGTSLFSLTAGSMATGQNATAVTLASANSYASSTTQGVGTYSNEITLSGATGSGGFLASNYNITYTPASLTINPRPISITASNQTRHYGSVGWSLGTTAFTVGGNGMVNGETIGGVTLTASGGTATSDARGTYTITPSAATGGTYTPANYSITAYNTGTLTVDPRQSLTPTS